MKCTGKKATCFTVVHTNYAEGASVYGYWDEHSAKENITTDANTEMKSLKGEGYAPVMLENPDGTIEVYVPDSDIHYEWTIYKMSIE